MRLLAFPLVAVFACSADGPPPAAPSSRAAPVAQAVIPAGPLQPGCVGYAASTRSVLCVLGTHEPALGTARFGIYAAGDVEPRYRFTDLDPRAPTLDTNAAAAASAKLVGVEPFTTPANVLPFGQRIDVGNGMLLEQTVATRSASSSMFETIVTCQNGVRSLLFAPGDEPTFVQYALSWRRVASGLLVEAMDLSSETKLYLAEVIPDDCSVGRPIEPARDVAAGIVLGPSAWLNRGCYGHSPTSGRIACVVGTTASGYTLVDAARGTLLYTFPRLDAERRIDITTAAAATRALVGIEPFTTSYTFINQPHAVTPWLTLAAPIPPQAVVATCNGATTTLFKPTGKSRIGTAQWRAVGDVILVEVDELPDPHIARHLFTIHPDCSIVRVGMHD